MHRMLVLHLNWLCQASTDCPSYPPSGKMYVTCGGILEKKNIIPLSFTNERKRNGSPGQVENLDLFFAILVLLDELIFKLIILARNTAYHSPNLQDYAKEHQLGKAALKLCLARFFSTETTRKQLHWCKEHMYVKS